MDSSCTADVARLGTLSTKPIVEVDLLARAELRRLDEEDKAEEEGEDEE